MYNDQEASFEGLIAFIWDVEAGQAQGEIAAILSERWKDPPRSFPEPWVNSSAGRVVDFFANAGRTIPREIFPTLTEREREILHLLAQSYSNVDIARDLSLSTKTVSNYLSNIFSKLQGADRATAILRAREQGWGRASGNGCRYAAGRISRLFGKHPLAPGNGCRVR